MDPVSAAIPPKNLPRIFVATLVQGRVKKRKAGELLQHLQQLLQNPNSDPATCLETLDYFLARLASMNTPSRLQVRVDDEIFKMEKVDHLTKGDSNLILP